MNGLGDDQLAEQARNGSPTALGALYARHADAVMGVAYQLLRSRTDAEDVLHDVFLGLPEALRRYEETGRFGAWLRRLAARVALTRIRTAGSRAEISYDDAASEPVLAHAGAVQDRIDRVALDHAIGELPPSLRTVFVLKIVEGYSHAEIAALLGITEGASEVRLVRAMKQLRHLLRSRHD